MNKTDIERLQKIDALNEDIRKLEQDKYDAKCLMREAGICSESTGTVFHDVAMLLIGDTNITDLKKQLKRAVRLNYELEGLNEAILEACKKHVMCFPTYYNDSHYITDLDIVRIDSKAIRLEGFTTMGMSHRRGGIDISATVQIKHLLNEQSLIEDMKKDAEQEKEAKRLVKIEDERTEEESSLAKYEELKIRFGN